MEALTHYMGLFERIMVIWENMNSGKPIFGLAISIILLLAPVLSAQGAKVPKNSDSVLLTVENKVQVAIGKGPWLTGKAGQPLNFGNRVRTGEYSRATVKLSNGSILRIDELTTIRLKPPVGPQKKPEAELEKGELYFFGRSKEDELQFVTPTANGAIRGTEFSLNVAENGTTVLTLIDGVVRLFNPLGAIDLQSGEQGTAAPGAPPRKTAVIDAINIIQWCLYYPGIIDPEELNWSAVEKNAHASSIEAYERGNLLEALSLFVVPKDRTLNSAENIYFAGLLLATGQVEDSAKLLSSFRSGQPLALALTETVAAVKGQAIDASRAPQGPSQLLARSYYLQSRSDLEGALQMARRAVEISPQFGFGWARVAELEFGFGRSRAVRSALEKARQFSPNNPQMAALEGFILAAENKLKEASEKFEEAIALDGALGNAWLGLGLTNIALNNVAEGRQHLQNAAALEPNRSLLRSYLGKGFSIQSSFELAENELRLARIIDPADPTPDLYGALLNRAQNRFNEAVHELERSLELNDNRRLYRSRFLLDQDRAVRGANLAEILQRAGLKELAVSEAGNAVTSDYGNFSAHRFLSNAYNELRDPSRINLRFEVAWANELFLANILSPVGAGNLSPAITQQEYSRLFTRRRPELSLSGSYRSDGRQEYLLSSSIPLGKTALYLDAEQTEFDEFFFNDDLKRTVVYGSLKHQINDRDSLYALLIYKDSENGDVFLRYQADTSIEESPFGRDPDFRFRERQEPLAFLAFHREWSPGVHTILMGARLDNEQSLSDKNRATLFFRSIDGVPSQQATPALDWTFESDLVIYSGEIQQIYTLGKSSFIVGGRIQEGDVENTSRLGTPSPLFSDLLEQRLSEDFSRQTVYGYINHSGLIPGQNINITLGLTYDRVEFPPSLGEAPLIAGRKTSDQVGPKAGLSWSPIPGWTLRAAYSRTQTGFSLDEPVRLEPNQVSGFIQAFRSVIPENLTGTIPAAKIETANFSVDGKLGPDTYFGMSFFRSDSDVERNRNAFEAAFFPFPPVNVNGFSFEENFDYEENQITLRLDHLLGDSWATGIRFKWNNAKINKTTPGLPETITPFPILQNLEADLINVSWNIRYQSPQGIFARGEYSYWRQDNRNYHPELPGDTFPMVNLELGFRLQSDRGEIFIGLLNATDEDYQINPLNNFNQLPRERTFIVSGRISF